MKRREKGPRQTAIPGKSEESSPDVHSTLFKPQSKFITTSVLAPETPPIVHSKCLNTVSTVASVMETPDCVLENNTKNKNDSEANTGKDVQRVSTAQEGGSEGGDESVFDISPDLDFSKRKNLLSILESEHSFSKSLQSQQMKQSSMIFGRNKVENTRKKLTEDLGRLSPARGRRKRRSLVDVILPFDLNSPENLSNKLNSIRETEEETRRLKRTPKRPTPVRRSLQRSSLIPDGSKAKKNTTIMFDNEDLLLTPVTTGSREVLEKTVHSILEGLQSENLDETEPVGGVQSYVINDKGKNLPGHSLQNFNTSSSTSACGELKSLGQTRPKDNLDGNTSGEMSRTETVGTSPQSDSPAEERQKDGCDATEGQLGPQPELKSILQGLVAYVEVRIGTDNRSAVIKDQLKALGAEVREKLAVDVTHVIFRDGSKSVFNLAKKRRLHLVSSLWVEACREKFQHVPEALFPSCSMESYSRPLFTRLRKLKSMQPKEFSEEENIAAARARRRLKTQNSPVTPSSAPIDVQFLTPQHNAAMKEAVDSPLFGISHLLTPQRQNPSSSSSSEEEDSNPGLDSPTKFNTPLVKRLYDRFTSPRSDSNKKVTNHGPGRNKDLPLRSSWKDTSCGSDRKRSEKERVDSVALENLECQMTVGSKESSAECVRLKLSLGEISEDNVEAVEMPIRLSQKQSQDETTNIRNQKQSDSQKKSKSRLLRSCRINGRLTGLPGVNNESPSSCKRSTFSLITDSSLAESESEDQPKFGDKTLNSLLTGLGDCGSDYSNDFLRNKVVQKRKSTSSDDDVTPGVSGLGTNWSATSKQGKYDIAPESPQKTGMTTRSRAKSLSSSSNAAQGKVPVTEDEKFNTVKFSRKRKMDNLTTSSEQSSSSSLNCGKNKISNLPSFSNNNKKLLSDPHEESQFPVLTDFPSTSCVTASQASRRKLLSVDVLIPSQELIVPVTPDAHERQFKGIYTDLKVKGSRSQRVALKECKDKSTMPLPRNWRKSNLGKKKPEESCSIAIETTTSSMSKYISKNKRSSASSASQNLLCKWSESENENVFSSGDESILPKPKILPLQQPRNSIEEFKNFNGLRSKKTSKRKSKTSNQLSICLTSVHSKLVENKKKDKEPHISRHCSLE